MPHKRKVASALHRCNKRICISVESLLREHYAIPRSPGTELANPTPIPLRVVITYLVDMTRNYLPTEELEEISDGDAEEIHISTHSRVSGVIKRVMGSYGRVSGIIKSRLRGHIIASWGS